jgi:hypothetical protein
MRVLSDVRRCRSEERASLEVNAAATENNQSCVVLARDFDERVAAVAGADDRLDVQRGRGATSASRLRAPLTSALPVRPDTISGPDSSPCERICGLTVTTSNWPSGASALARRSSARTAAGEPSKPTTTGPASNGSRDHSVATGAELHPHDGSAARLPLLVGGDVMLSEQRARPSSCVGTGVPRTTQARREMEQLPTQRPRLGREHIRAGLQGPLLDGVRRVDGAGGEPLEGLLDVREP